MVKYKIFAAIDLGSTAIYMRIAEISKKNGINIIDTIRYDISLGKETYAVGKISYSSVEEICKCLENFVTIMKSYGVEEYTCYATTAIREAENSEYIIDQVNIRTGIKVTIISNEQERFLHNKAFALDTDYFDECIEKGAVIVDIASGSTQISSYENSMLRFSQNIYLGCLRVLELLSNIKNSTLEFEGLLEEYIKANIDNYKRNFLDKMKHENFVGITNQSDNIKLLCGSYGDKITKEEINKAYKILNSRSIESISEEFLISYDDAQLLLPTMIIIKMFFDNTESDVIYMPNILLVDGICVEYVEKMKIAHTNHMFTGDIISSASYYAKKYKVDKKHYEKVIDFSSSIIKVLSKRFGISKKDMLLLEVAAILADTGIYINVNDYNRYSYDIVKSNPILGLSGRENEIISFVVLFQKGLFSFGDYNSLSKKNKLLISKLASVLSLAKNLDLEYNQKIDKIKTSFRDGQLFVTAVSNEDITLEEWKFKNSCSFFEEVFGIKVNFKKSR